MRWIFVGFMPILNQRCVALKTKSVYSEVYLLRCVVFRLRWRVNTVGSQMEFHATKTAFGWRGFSPALLYAACEDPYTSPPPQCPRMFLTTADSSISADHLRITVFILLSIRPQNVFFSLPHVTKMASLFWLKNAEQVVALDHAKWWGSLFS